MTLPALIAAMLRPEFYPHRPAAVDLVQTHISYVLLAGDHVYKIKKPVRFSFLDFSTLERRRHFCHEELRLNRRLAADAYLGVVAIRADFTGYVLAPEDDPHAVEYAVHMRRLPAERTLERLLERHEATPALIDAIAARLAEFHRQADAGPAVRAYGDPAAILQVVENNYRDMRPFRDVTISSADDDAIQEFSRTFLQRHEVLLRARQDEQRIRDCHGDLHSEHICCGDRLTIFDCIEFNEAFRYCDVASEIAFLAMDLDYHGQPELTAHLVSRYVAYTGDPDLPRLLPFYQCHRAYVRGKVGSLKSAEGEVADAEREAARRSAWRHFALAYRYTWAGNPWLVVVSGLSGTGKSVIAAALHARTGFVHLNSDIVRKRLAGIAATARLTGAERDALYAPAQSARTYMTMLAEAARHLAGGRGVILDATFSRRVDRDAARAAGTERGIPVLIAECRCPDEVVRRRLAHRVARDDSPSDADWSIYLQQRRHHEPLAADEPGPHLVLDTTAPAADLSAAIENALRDARRAPAFAQPSDK
jgi:uncharacterized protein